MKIHWRGKSPHLIVWIRSLEGRDVIIVEEYPLIWQEIRLNNCKSIYEKSLVVIRKNCSLFWLKPEQYKKDMLLIMLLMEIQMLCSWLRLRLWRPFGRNLRWTICFKRLIIERYTMLNMYYFGRSRSLEKATQQQIKRSLYT